MSGDAQLIVTERNQPESRAVIQIVGTFRGVAAGIAACVVLSGCAPGQVGGETTTSPAATETPANPWDLPIEQRPALFDPCAEIPVEAVEQGVGGPVEAVESLKNHRPGELLSCGWKSDEVLLDVLSTWKSHENYLADPSGFISNMNLVVTGRNALRLTDREEAPTACRYLFFSSYGTVAVSLSLTTSLETFNGQHFSEVCAVLGEASAPLVSFIPEGDFR